MLISRICLFLLLALSVFPTFASTSYGTSETDWRVVDDKPAGATIGFVDEPLLGRSVVQTMGEGRSNSYMVGGYNSSSGWNNQSEFLISWNLRAAEAVTIYVRVETVLGWRYLYYNHSSKNNLLNASGRYIHHGLGTTFKDGEWHTWSRDLVADLKDAEPDNDIVAVNGVVIRGNLLIDGITLNQQNQAPLAVIDSSASSMALGDTLTLDSQNSSDPDGALYTFEWRDSAGTVLSDATSWQAVRDSVGTQRYSLQVSDNEGLSAVVSTSVDVVDVSSPTSYSDAEDGSLDGWRLSDKTPDGATIENIVDAADSENRVIHFTGNALQNSMVLGNTNPSRGWNNSLQKHVTWRSRSDNDFRIYVRVTTPDGWRYIWYDTRDTSRLANGNGTYIHHALGADARDGQWHTYSRDLEADLQLAQSDNTIIAVHAVVVRGTVSLDDIALHGGAAAEPPAPTEPPSTPVNLSPSVDALVEANTSQTFTWEAQALASAYDFGLFDRVDDAFTATYDLDANDICSDGVCSFESLLTLPVHANHAWRVRAKNVSGISEWSRSEFDVVEPLTAAPAAPDIILPADDAVFEPDATIVLQWQADTLARTYDFNLVNPNDQTTSENVDIPASDICTSTTCTLSKPNDLPIGDGYQLRISASNRLGSSAWSERTFSIAETIVLPPPGTPINVSPAVDAEIAANSTQSFTWEAQEVAASYELLLVDRIDGAETRFNDIASADACADGLCSFDVLIELPVHSDHAWRVRARNAFGISGWSRSVFDVVEPLASAPPAPVIVLPAENTAFAIDATIVLQWEANALAHTFDFELVNPFTETTTTNAGIPADTICDGITCSLSKPNDLPAGEGYQLRIRAANRLGDSAWSERSFSITEPVVVAAPVIPVPLSPALDARIESGTTQTFTWQAQAVATSYDFLLFNRVDDAVTVTNDINASEACVDGVCSFDALIELPVHADHAWRVRAKNASGISAWSRTEFDVVEPLTTPPGNPVVVLPADNAEFALDDTIVLQWQADTQAQTYDFGLVNPYTQETTYNSGIASTDICTASVCTLSKPNDLPVGEGYQLRIRAVNAIGTSDWSERTFSIAEPVTEKPAVPVNLTPEAGVELIAGQSYTFTWAESATAVSYEFHFYDNVEKEIEITGGLIAADICTDGVCSFEALITLPVFENHAWRVRAKNAAGFSGWSRSLLDVIADPDGPTDPAAAPVAAFTLAASSGVAPFNASVDASSSTDTTGITNYRWEFADQLVVEGADEVTASHVFEQPGSYAIKLTVSNAEGLNHSTTNTVTVTQSGPVDNSSSTDAARLLTQASFGTSMNAIAEVQALGVEGWIDRQLSLQGAAHLDYVSTYSNGSNRDARHEIWWKDAIDGEDQLRSRVAYALSQLLVVSDVGFTLSNAQYGMTHYYDLLRNNAFANYRDLLEDITLSPVMGIYLSMLQNDKGDPSQNTRADENFARELMQLFSIGLHNLNQDGSLAGGNTYTQQDVENFARVFTGWNYKDAGRWDRPLFTGQDLISPMEPYEDHHDTGAKTLLGGVTIPAGLSAREDLERALDNIFAHDNVAPFVVTHLIKQMITSNPTPAYVARVAAVFNDNGNGVKGDLGATVKAMLLDEEARNADVSDNFGKLREPVLRLSHLWRAFAVSPGNQSVRGEYNTYSPALKNLETITGQAVLRASSVFNFYHPEYTPKGPVSEAQLSAPEFEIFTDGNILSTASRLNDQIIRHYKQNPSSSERNPSYLDYTEELALAGNTQALLDRLNLLLLSSSMSTQLNDLLLTHLDSLPDDDTGLRRRVQDAIALIVASPEYLVQK